MLAILCFLLSLLILASSCFAIDIDAQDTSNTYPMVFRMNYQNSDGSRGSYINTTRPVIGWNIITSTGTDPVSTNIGTGEMVLYYDGTASNAGLIGMQKDVRLVKKIDHHPFPFLKPFGWQSFYLIKK